MYNTTKQTLLNAPVPQQTRTYKPVSHEQLIDLTLGGIEKAGFKLDKEMYSAARDGSIANGRFTISNVMDKEMQLEVGWQNSYDKSLTLKFAIGTRIMICQNGCVSGDYGAFKKKHVGAIQTFTPNAITEYIKGAGDVFRRMQEERDRMKEIEVSRRTQAELIGRMLLEEQFIQSTQVNIISREINKPTFDYGAPGSMWELYQFTTQSMREVHPTLWMDNHIKAHNFFVNESGILVAPPQMVDAVEEIIAEPSIPISQFSSFTL
jgi:hypothetical protein